MRIDQGRDKPRPNGSARARRVFVDLFCLSSLPWVLLAWVGGWILGGVKPLRIYYFAISPRAERALRSLTRLLPVGADEADYSIVELVDTNGSSTWLQAWTEDLREVCDAITEVYLKDHRLVQRVGRRFGLPQVLGYLEKHVFAELQPVMTHIRVAEWYRRQWQLDGDTEVVLFVSRSPWHRQVAAYAAAHGVRLAGYGPPAGWRPRAASQWLWRFLRFVSAGVARMAGSAGQAVTPTHPVAAEISGPARIAVGYSGMGLTLDPSKRSDLFWLPAANAEPGQVLVYFERDDDPVDEAKKSLLEGAGISCVAMNRQAVACEGVDVWRPEIHPNAKALHGRLARWLLSSAICVAWRSPRNLGWLVPRLDDLIGQYSSWHAFFSTYNVKVHVSFIDWPAARVAADIALSDLGGISVSYERTSEHFLSVFRSSVVDVHFAFGHNGAQTERRSGSYIAQYVSAGYSVDNSFAAVRERAGSLRARLRRSGARFIICYFDENSGDNKRVAIIDHVDAAMSYAYLLQRLLDDTSLGLILKPKKPTTLRARLGPVANLLDEALATGRCHMFDRGIVATDVLPNEASQAADIAIGLLLGSTAGLESVLAGTPTVLLDRENLRQHPFYQWGRDGVVFEDWETLYEAVTAYRGDPASLPGFGDWSPVLDQMDPFRDGRAAERMGTYVRWLVDGLSIGQPAGEALERAGGRYVASWGADKVIGLRDGANASAQGETAFAGGPEDVSTGALVMTARKGSAEEND